MHNEGDGNVLHDSMSPDAVGNVPNPEIEHTAVETASRQSRGHIHSCSCSPEKIGALTALHLRLERSTGAY